MSLSLFKKKPVPSRITVNRPTGNQADGIVELLYAGNALATYLTFPAFDNATSQCICGVRILGGPVEHRKQCPVGRFMIAVEAVRREVL